MQEPGQAFILKSQWEAWVGPQVGYGKGLRVSTRAEVTMLSRLLETHIWCLPARSVGKGFRKEQLPLPALLSGRKLPFQFLC